MRRYNLVFEHDRAGRLIEAHEFEHLRIPRSRFAASLVEELLSDAAATVRIEGEDVIINHAYIERRVRPLNVFFADADEQAAIGAACDYAQAIKDLAASNIFPGDLLTKQFCPARGGMADRTRIDTQLFELRRGNPTQCDSFVRGKQLQKSRQRR